MFSKLQFILGLKRQPYKQGIGKLFMVDAETSEIYACALGQGALSSELITEEKVLRELKDSGSTFVADIIDNGKIIKRKVFYNSNVEGEVQNKLNEALGNDFCSWVIDKNDTKHEPVTEIGFEAREKFADLWVE